jgi:micrococcal nuclease
MFWIVEKSKSKVVKLQDALYYCSGVKDGDTIVLRTNNGPVNCRLAGVDAPEMSQRHGNQAYKYVRSLVLHRWVFVESLYIGKYGRLIAHVYVDGVNLAELLLKNGHAWVYVRYVPPGIRYIWLEYQEKARIAKLGLWRYDNARAPWLFRRLSS